MPLELEFKIKVLEHKWRQSNDEERLDILLSLLNENFVLHSELTRRDKELGKRSVELPPVPPPPEPKKEFPVGFCFDFWRLTVAVWWGKRQ